MFDLDDKAQLVPEVSQAELKFDSDGLMDVDIGNCIHESAGEEALMETETLASGYLGAQDPNLPAIELNTVFEDEEDEPSRDLPDDDIWIYAENPMASPAASNSDVESLSQADSQQHAESDTASSQSPSSGAEQGMSRPTPGHWQVQLLSSTQWSHSQHPMNIVCPKCRTVSGKPVAVPKSEEEAMCSQCQTWLYNQISSSYFDLGPDKRPSVKKPVKPKVVVPFASLKDLLSELLAHPGVEDQLNAWREQPATEGTYKAIWHGNIWKTICDADGNLFFGPRKDDKLRIGVTCGLDWYTVPGLPLRFLPKSLIRRSFYGLGKSAIYHVENMFIPTFTAGPTEPTANQLQHQVKFVVDELLQLYTHGVIIKTPWFPNGRLVRVVCIALICDHPAAVKMCGSADKGHNQLPCTRCQVPKEDLFSDEALCDGYHERDTKTHIRQAYKYATLDTDSEREDFFSKYGTRWFEFARLKYFDPIRMTVIDPMHNLLIGVLKNHWYSIWIQGKALRAKTQKNKRELDLVHELLNSFEMPSFVGRPARQVGEQAGGSLSADTYKGLGCVFLPALIPFVWEASLPGAHKEFQQANETFSRRYDEWQKKHGSQASTVRNKKLVEPPKAAELRMRPGDYLLFLKLGATTKIYTQYEITHKDVRRAEGLVQEYLMGFKKRYGIEKMKPNHHFLMHLPAQIHDYGPVYGFWCFLGEHLNKLLKSFQSNNWGGGQLEVSMMREWGRDVQLHEMLRLIAESEMMNERWVAGHLIKNLTEARGTVEAVAAAREDALMDASLHSDLIRGPVIAQLKVTPRTADHALLAHYKDIRGASPLYLPLDINASLVKAQLNDKLLYGEITSIFEHLQPGYPPFLFAEIRWFKTLQDCPLETDVWADFPELDVQFHARDVEAEFDARYAVILFEKIVCHLARGILPRTDPPQWITITLDKMSAIVS
ncbi:hypothetical protein JB92DRAFT_3132926 [Gautieria morchelliformis]|nr:hypothetical protein JB92DRAFT_3132926 [Gautieria morchelliformis]